MCKPFFCRQKWNHGLVLHACIFFYWTFLPCVVWQKLCLSRLSRAEPDSGAVAVCLRAADRKGDYHRYLAEFATGNERKDAAENSLLAYKAATDIAMTELPPTHPIR